MLSLVAAASLAYVGPLTAGPVVQRRLQSPMMGAEKKVIAYQDFEDGVFEGREVDAGVPPVYLLSRLNELKFATWVSEAGLLSFAEEKKVFSTLENAGAFSTAEKLLPLVEKFKLLSIFEKALDVPNGFIFTAAITLLTFPLNLAMLQGFSIVPGVRPPTGLFIPLELGVDAAALALGAGLFAMAFAVGKLQED